MPAILFETTHRAWCFMVFTQKLNNPKYNSNKFHNKINKYIYIIYAYIYILYVYTLSIIKLNGNRFVALFLRLVFVVDVHVIWFLTRYCFSLI